MSGTKIFSFPIRVFIEDTDAGGIVYYVNYLKFMERARTEFMRALGHGKQQIFDDNIMFVVQDVSVKYHKPAQLDDELEATATVIECGKAWLLFAQDVLKGSDLLVGGQVKIVCVNRQTMKPTAIPTLILTKLKETLTV